MGKMVAGREKEEGCEPRATSYEVKAAGCDPRAAG